eukprot:1641371-Heterocapsa_arctica.AAC.1
MPSRPRRWRHRCRGSSGSCHGWRDWMRVSLRCRVPAQVVDVVLSPSDGRVDDVDSSAKLRVDVASHLLGAVVPVVAA